VVLTPWCIRNKICFGEVFITQFTGRASWDGCCFDGKPSQLPMSLADGPSTRQLLRATDHCKTESLYTWTIYNNLRLAGYTEVESDRLMKQVAFGSIRANPIRFVAAAGLRYVWFWLNPKSYATQYPWGSHYAAGVGKPARVPGPNQRGWSVASLAAVNAAFLRVAWHPRWHLCAVAAIVAHAGCFLMIWNPKYRDTGLAILSLFVAIPMIVAVFGWPQQRYRMILDPAMIVAIAFLIVVCSRVRRPVS
jgi:hypothetical protein